MDEYTSPLAARMAKLRALRELVGVDPYPARTERTHRAGDVVANYDNQISRQVTVAGRLTALRGHGKATFADLTDDSGRVQLYFKADALGSTYEIVKLLDLGDFVGATGTVFKTRTGEVTVAVEAFQVLAKGLRTPPVVKAERTDDGAVLHDEFADPEKRYRKRYLDMLVNAEAKERIRTRAQVIAAVRSLLHDRGYVEIETPILQPLYGGANARPFVTHHNVLDMDLYLRIADELYLKRLLVAGFEKVFEIGKDFRNEGIDRTHYPEFTMLEAYEAFGDYNTMMTLAQEIILAAASQTAAGYETSFAGRQIDLTPPWPRVSMTQELSTRLGVDVLNSDLADLTAKGLEALAAAAADAGDALQTKIRETESAFRNAAASLGKGSEDEGARAKARARLLDAAFDVFVAPGLCNPTFVVDYPAVLSPLAKRVRENDELAERFELFVAGMEVANAFSEQNDPLVQRQAFEAQARQRAAGDEEAQQIDEDFLEALEYGMPPAGGLGIGIDRLVMILTDAPNIREVISFPQLRVKPK